MKLQKKLTGAISLIAMITSATAVIGQEIKVWTTETQPARLERQAKMAAEYEASTGVKVEMIPVEESEMGTRATAAFAAGDLPDVIYYGLQYALPWTEAGILDTEAAQEVVDALGSNTFAPGPIQMATTPNGVAGVPVDGWTQMVVYRKDLFEANELEAPSSYKNVTTALSKLHLSLIHI